MLVRPTALTGVLVVEPEVFGDERGFILESFNATRFAKHGLPTSFPQDNHSHSKAGVLRGLHFQRTRPQGKLVTVMRGRVFDVAVDVRRGSPTFGKWVSETLSEDAPQYFYIPPGFAHGFCVLSDVADVVYKCTEVYDASDDRGVLWNDPGLAIPWPIKEPTLSAKDRSYPRLTADRDDLPSFG